MKCQNCLEEMKYRYLGKWVKAVCDACGNEFVFKNKLLKRPKSKLRKRKKIMQELSKRSLKKKKERNARQDFMLTLFDKPEGNEFKELNGFILEKWFDNNYHRWMVSVFTPESFKRKQEFWNKQQKLLKE